jgi:glycosyltransferase involved in cell wall biosynthesis
MESPTVSVIIPTFNCAVTIGRSIRSILKQTYKNYEIIIVDDASTDNTEEIVKSFKYDKIIYFRMTENKGLFVCCNMAIKTARGEYIAFLNPDDEWLQTKLSKQLQVFDKSKDPDLAAAYCGFIMRDEIINRTLIINNNYHRGSLYHQLLRNPFPSSSPSLFLVKKEALLKVNGFDEKLPTFEDYDLWLRLALSDYTFDFVEEPLAIKYKEEGEQPGNDPAKRQAGLILFLHRWGDEIIRVAGKRQFNNFRKKNTESLVRTIINNPGKDYRGSLKSSLELLSQVKSLNLSLYAKALYILMTGKKPINIDN